MKNKLSFAFTFVLASAIFINQVQAASDITLSNGQVWAGADEAGTFTYNEAMSVTKPVCASGYHLPSESEWRSALSVKDLATFLKVKVGKENSQGSGWSDFPVGIYWVSTSPWVDHYSPLVAFIAYSAPNGNVYYDNANVDSERFGVRCIKNVGTTTETSGPVTTVTGTSDITLSNGQVWAGADQTGVFTRLQAVSACAKGYHLPSKAEWETAFNVSNLGVTLNLSSILTVINAAAYWTSDPTYVGTGSDSGVIGYAVYYSDSHPAFVDTPLYVRCIKDAASTSGTTGTVTGASDITLSNGQVWAGVDAGVFGALEARFACTGEYRLPTLDELKENKVGDLRNLTPLASQNNHYFAAMDGRFWIWGVNIINNALYSGEFSSGWENVRPINEIVAVRCIRKTRATASTVAATTVKPITITAQKSTVSGKTEVSATAVAGGTLKWSTVTHNSAISAEDMKLLDISSFNFTSGSSPAIFTVSVGQWVRVAEILNGKIVAYGEHQVTASEIAGVSTINPLNIDNGIPGGEVTLKVDETISYSFTKGFDAVEFRDSWGGKLNNTVASGHVDTSNKQLKLTGKAVGKVYVKVRMVMGAQADSIDFILNVVAPSAGTAAVPAGGVSVPVPVSGCLDLKESMSIGSNDTNTNGEVTLLQRFLVGQKYLTQAQMNTGAGNFGPLTRDAVMLFQADNNISPIGIVGPLTRATIKAGTCGANNTASVANGTSATNLTNTTATQTVTYATPVITTGTNSTPAKNLSECSADLDRFVSTNAGVSCEVGQGMSVVFANGACYFSHFKNCTDCNFLTTEQRQVGVNAQTCANTSATEYKWTSVANNAFYNPACTEPHPVTGSNCTKSQSGTTCLSSADDRIYSCGDVTTSNGNPFFGKVIDEQGNGMAGVTVSIYTGGPSSFMTDALTNVNGDWYIIGGSYHKFAWFHNKPGYETKYRMGLSAGGKQADWVMKKLKPLSLSPSVVELPREEARDVSFTLNNYDIENDSSDPVAPDLEICAVKNADTCTNFVKYKDYSAAQMANYWGGNGLYFSLNRANVATFKYDALHFPSVTSTNKMLFAIRRASDRNNVTTGVINLVNGQYSWQLDGTYNTVRDKTGPWAQPVCSSSVSTGSSCSVSSVGATCAKDDSSTSWRSFRCGLVGSTVSDVTVTPTYSQMNMSTSRLPVHIAVNGISNAVNNTKICNEVLAHPNVPSAVDAGKCSNPDNYTSFTGNSDWTATSNGWIGNIRYNSSVYGVNGLKVKNYFMDATSKRYAGATIEVVGGEVSEAAAPTAEILWNGSIYVLNVDPTDTHTLTWKSTNADTLVQSKVEFSNCENGNNRTIDPWDPWSGGSGNFLNGSSINAGSPNDAGCYVRATYKVKNSATGKIVSASAFMSYKASKDIKQVTTPGNLPHCPSDTSGLGNITCVSNKEIQTITSCVPADYENTTMWTWTRTPVNSFAHQTGKTCGVIAVPDPTVDILWNGSANATNVDPLINHSLELRSTNAVNLVSSKVTYSEGVDCKSPYKGQTINWAPFGNAVNGSDSSPSSSLDYSCTVTATVVVANSTGKTATNIGVITFKSAPAGDPTIAPNTGGMHYCGTSGFKAFDDVTRPASEKVCVNNIYRQTIKDCVPQGADVSPALLSNGLWNRVSNGWERSTGESCGISTPAPVVTFTINVTQATAPDDIIKKTWTSKNFPVGSVPSARWSASGSLCVYNSQSGVWDLVTSYTTGTPENGSESFAATTDQVGCTFTITYTVTPPVGQGQPVSASDAVTIVAPSVVVPTTPTCSSDPVAYYYHHNGDVKDNSMYGINTTNGAKRHWNDWGWKETSRPTCWTTHPIAVSSVKSVFATNYISPKVLGDFASNVSCVDIPRNLIRGTESSYVTKLQNFLVQKGFLVGETSGLYLDKTMEAVKDYQASKGLPVTGMVYDFTRQAIKNDSCN